MIKKYFFLLLYYGLFRKLPKSSVPFFGNISKYLRYTCCKHIFLYCGKSVNIDRNAYFGNGLNVQIGDYSGIGYNCIVPNNIIIGKYVMMAPEVFIPRINHNYSDINIPMSNQGVQKLKKVIIGDDVWIGRRAIINPGRTIKKGTVIAAASLVHKDYEAYSIIGGNPSMLIRFRHNQRKN